MALDFRKTQSKAMVDDVMKKVDDTELDNKKRDVPLDQIDLNPDNEVIFGYDEIDHLASRIEENGFYGAIEVYAKKDGRYEIASGHRRYLACKMLGKETIPCIITADVDDRDKAKHLIEGNIHNRKMTPYKTAMALDYYDKHVLMPENKNQGSSRKSYDKFSSLSKVFNISRTSTIRYLSILNLIPELQECTNKENVSYTNIIGLSSLPEEDQKNIYQDLKKIAGNDDIMSLSKTLIDQIANRYKEKQKIEKERKKAEEERRKFEEENKKKGTIAEEDNAELDVSIRGRSLSQQRVQEQNDDEVTYFTQPVPSYVDYSEDEDIENSSIIQEPNKAVEEENEEEQEIVATKKPRRANDSYMKMTYYLKLIEDIDVESEGWTEEEKRSIKNTMTKILQKL